MFDITKDAEFFESRKKFKIAMNELKEMGLGGIDHHKEITEEGKLRVWGLRLNWGFDWVSPKTRDPEMTKA